MPKSMLRELEVREGRMKRFCDLVFTELHLQLAVRQIVTVGDLVALSQRHDAPLDHMDVALCYRQLNQSYWPWHGKPMQVRRHFAHLGRLPEGL